MAAAEAEMFRIVTIYQEQNHLYLTSLGELRANNHDTRSQERLALKVPHTNCELEKVSSTTLYYWNEYQHSLKIETLIPLRDFKVLLDDIFL